MNFHDGLIVVRRRACMRKVVNFGFVFVLGNIIITHNLFVCFGCVCLFFVCVGANLFKVCNNSQSEFVCCVLSAQIFGSNFAGFQYTVDSIRDYVTVVMQIHVTQQFRTT